MPVLQATMREIVCEHAPPPFVLAGKSMGGRVATMLADELGAAGVLVFGYPFHPPRQPTRLRTEHQPRCARRAWILQGERDPFGTRAQVAAYALAPGITIEWLPGRRPFAGAAQEQAATPPPTTSRTRSQRPRGSCAASRGHLISACGRRRPGHARARDLQRQRVRLPRRRSIVSSRSRSCSTNVRSHDSAARRGAAPSGAATTAGPAVATVAARTSPPPDREAADGGDEQGDGDGHALVHGVALPSASAVRACCSALCFCSEPVAGLAAARRSALPDHGKRSRTNVHAPMFAGSSWHHTNAALP